MNKPKHLVIRTIQYSIIVLALLMTIFRASVDSFTFKGYIESWFAAQGVAAKVAHMSTRVDDLTPEFYIAGLTIFKKNKEVLVELQHATLTLNLIQSVLQQQLIFDELSFALDKLVLDSPYETYQYNMGGEKDQDSLLSQTALTNLLKLKRLTFLIKDLQLTVLNKKQYSIYNTEFSLVGEQQNKVIQLRSGLYQQKQVLLDSQLKVDVVQLVKDRVIKGSAFSMIKLPDLSKSYDVLGNVLNGEVLINSWITFEKDEIFSISNLVAKQIEFDVDNKKQIVNASTNFVNLITDDKWILTADADKVEINQRHLSPFEVSLRTQYDQGDFKQNILFVEDIAIESFISSLDLLPKSDWKKRLKQSKIKGFVKRFQFQVDSLNDLESGLFAIEVDDLEWDAVEKIPAIKRLDTSIYGSANKMDVSISADDFNLGFKTLFSNSIKAEKLKTNVMVYRQPNQVVLNIPSIEMHRNKATVNGNGLLVIDEQSSPYMALDFELKNTNIQSVSQYYPDKIMSENVLGWLKTSIKNADVKQAKVTYRGRTQHVVDFKSPNQGVFKVDIDIENLDLKFSEEWPGVKSPKGHVLFHNMQLLVDAKQATIDDITADDVRFTIKDLSHAEANLSLHVADTVDKQWAFLRKTPIYKDIPFFTDITDLKGQSSSNVNVYIPIANEINRESSFNLRLNAKDAGFSLTQFAVDLSHINGEIKLNDEALSFSKLKADWFGQAVELNASTSKDKTVAVDIKGAKLNYKNLVQIMPETLAPLADGESAWNVALRFNQLKVQQNKQVVFELMAHSDLLGTKIDLPMPLAKPLTKEQSINVALKLFDSGDLDLAVDLEEIVKFSSNLKETEDGRYTLWGSDVHFGGADYQTVAQQGLYINGQIEQFNLGEWQTYLGSLVEIEGDFLDSLESLHEINLQMNSLQLSKVVATDSLLKLKKNKTGLQGEFVSSIAKGSIFLPIKQEKNIPIVLDMEHISLKFEDKAKETQKSSFLKDIKRSDAIPNLQIKSKLFTINDNQFKDMELLIETHEQNYFELKKFALTHNDVTLNVAGHWEHDPFFNDHKSKLFIGVKGGNLGASLLALGGGDVMNSGAVDFNGDLAWDSTFFDLDLALATGAVQLLIKNGAIKNVEPGSARFVGLLSLSALPRRLILDFSDVVKEGMVFDDISGKFSIHDGSLWTQNLKMSGASSDVKIEGRTGFMDQDYDQKITIIPQIRQTLPVLGSIISGSTTGWALLLFQKLFKKPIDESVTIRYTLKGTWDDPKIDLVQQPKKEDENETVH